MKVYILIVLVALWLGLGFDASGKDLPDSIKTCTTDADCEYKEWLLCTQGELEWCVEIARR